MANSAESVAAGTQKRGKHRLDAAAQPQIGVPDNTGGDLGFADRAHLDRTRVPVHRVRLHIYRCNNVVASTGISQEVVQHVGPSRPDPEVVMRVYDGKLGFERRLLAPIQPILAHRAWRCRLLRGCGERKGSRCAAEKSNELAPFHRCLPFRCGDWLYVGSSAPDSAMAASSTRLRDAPPAPCGKNYTLSRCSEREGHDE